MTEQDERASRRNAFRQRLARRAGVVLGVAALGLNVALLAFGLLDDPDVLARRVAMAPALHAPAPTQVPTLIRRDTTAAPEIDVAKARMAAMLAKRPPARPKVTPPVVTVSADRLRDAGTGIASYYGQELAGQPTASGEPFRPEAFTAAHRTLPFGSLVRVTNLRNDRSVVVRINDRGPFTGSRVIDVSAAAAREIGMYRAGTARVKIEVIQAQ